MKSVANKNSLTLSKKNQTKEFLFYFLVEIPRLEDMYFLFRKGVMI